MMNDLVEIRKQEHDTPFLVSNSHIHTESKVFIASTRLEIEKIEHFRYSVYINELEKPLPWANHQKKTLADPLDKEGFHFYSLNKQGEVASCGRLHYGKSLPGNVAKNLNLERFIDGYKGKVAYISKLMTASTMRSGILTARLMGSMYVHSREQGCVLGFCHASPELSNLYINLGLHVLESSFIDPYVGSQVPLALILEDEHQFSNKKSIFLPYSKLFINDENNVKELIKDLNLKSDFRYAK